MSRQLSIRLGREGPIQRYSLVHQANVSTTADVWATLQGTVHSRIRDQTLSDPTKCSQFVCVFGDAIGFLTRPLVTERENFPPTVVGSFSDRIGTCVPVGINLPDFQGSFTTLTKRSVAEAFSLPIHPRAPDTVDGPPPPAADDEEDDPVPVPACMGRLQFLQDADHAPGNHPVIAAFPNYLPLPPGVSFPENATLADPASYAAAPDLVRAWCDGIRYLRQHNGGYSVTQGGPLFHLPDLVLEAEQDPFAALDLVQTLPVSPVMLPPTLPLYPSVHARFSAWADDNWAHLGAQRVDLTAPATPTNGIGLSPDQITALVTPLVAARAVPVETKSTKELEQAESANDAIVSYQIAFAIAPEVADPTATADAMIIPELTPEFRSILHKSKPMLAAQAMLEFFRSTVERFLTSSIGVDCDVTFDAEAVTMAFANAVRSMFWLIEPLSRTPKHVAILRLCLLHFLPPIRAVLLAQKGSEATSNPIVLSHVSDDKAQLEASKASTLYAGGRLESVHDVYLAVCNLRMFILAVVQTTGDQTPLLLKKLLAYVNVLKSFDGRIWAETYRNNFNIVLHVFMDVQHILCMFMSLSKRSGLKEAIKAGKPIAPNNYWNAVRIADGLVDKLKGIISDNNLGLFNNPPVVANWFINPHASTQDTPSRPGKVPPTTPPTRPTPPSAGAPKKPRTKDQSEIDRQKTLGMLVYDSQTSGSTRLPHCPVYGKARKNAADERFCMQFLTTGYFCSRTNCPFPHVTSLNRLSKQDKDTFVAWVEKTPGLSFADGKGPAGTKT